jgi:hypothetical protein
MRTRSPFLLLGLVFILGCSDSKYAPVSGTVTMDGEPLADVLVTFQPAGDTMNPGPGSSGRTNDKGEYTLKVIGENQQGAVIGMHTVQIQHMGAGKASAKVNIPPKYNSLTELKYEVKRGNNTANFELKSK